MKLDAQVHDQQSVVCETIGEKAHNKRFGAENCAIKVAVSAWKRLVRFSVKAKDRDEGRKFAGFSAARRNQACTSQM